MRTNVLRTLAVALLFFTGCAPRTSFVNTWAAPDAAPLDFKKVLVIGAFPNDQMRRSAEDQIVSKIKNAQAVASYTVLNMEELKDKDLAKAKIEGQGFDGAVVVRYQGTDKRTEYVPGTAYSPGYYGSFYGYYGYASPVIYDPGYVAEYRVVQIETTIFSLPDEKMIWAGLSETEDPSSLQQLIDSVSQSAATELRKRDLIK